MPITHKARTAAKVLAPLAVLLALGACKAKEENYVPDVKDESGGQLIATDQQPDAVPVDVPTTEMTPVPPATASATPPADTASDAAAK